MKLARILGMVALLAATLTSQTGTHKTNNDMQASFVRICKNKRGQNDRRACRSKEDSSRSILAANF